MMQVLPLHMHIRFLEVILLDLNTLLSHVDQEAYLVHNRTLLYGFVLNLSQSYADQNCPDLLQTLDKLSLFLNRLKEKDSDKAALLETMIKHVTHSIAKLNGERANDEDPLGR